MLNSLRSKPSLDISGLFTMYSITPVTRIAWVLGGLACAAVLWFCVNSWVNGELFGSQTTGMEFLVAILLLFVLPGFVVCGSIYHLFQKPGVYLRGIRTSESGFEEGLLTADLESVEPAIWREMRTGTFMAGEWTSTKVIDDEKLFLAVYLKEAGEDSDFRKAFRKHYFFERLVILSKDGVLHELKNSNDGTRNHLVSMRHGHFGPLGGDKTMTENSLLPALETIADIVSLANPSTPLSCTLVLVPYTVRGAASMSFGLVGGLITAGIDYARRQAMEKALKNGNLFTKEATDKLLEFLQRRNWRLTDFSQIASTE